MQDDLAVHAMDPNGNTSAIASLGGLTGFGYDDRNRLALVQQNLKTVMRYALNGRGERVRKELAGKQAVGRDFIYDESGRLIAEYTDRNAGSKDYVWADDTLVAMYATDSQGTATLHNIYTDGLGTPRAMTGAGGKITLWSWPARQNPFGERAAIGMPDALNLRFPGQYYDDETGLHYNYFRDYEARTGRYAQSDPVGLGGDVSTYSYAMNRPMAFVDSDALAPFGGIFWDAWNHYCDGTGTPWTISFSSVDWGGATKTIERIVQAAASSQGCKNAALSIMRSFEGAAIGDYKYVIGRHTLKVTGSLNTSCNCTWKFSGQLTSATGEDRYNFNPSNRSWLGEFETWVGRMRCPATRQPFSIYVPGSSAVSLSGRNAGASKEGLIYSPSEASYPRRRFGTVANEASHVRVVEL